MLLLLLFADVWSLIRVISIAIWLVSGVLEGIAYCNISKRLDIPGGWLMFVPVGRWIQLRKIQTRLVTGDRTMDKLFIIAGALRLIPFLGGFSRMALKIAGWYAAATMYEKFAFKRYMLLVCVSVLIPLGSGPCLLFAANRLKKQKLAQEAERVDSEEKI